MANYPDQYINIPQPQIMEEAKASLSNRWSMVIPAMLVYFVVSIGANIIPLASLIIGAPMALGLAIFSLRISRNQEAEISTIFDGFQNFGNALAAFFLMMLAIILGFICLIVPGIILAFGLSQTFFILADEPEIGPVEALKKSWEMMKGQKMNYFVLNLRFIGWAFLCIFTLFIGYLWLIPYMQVTFANFHDELKRATYPEDYDDEDDIVKHLVD